MRFQLAFSSPLSAEHVFGLLKRALELLNVCLIFQFIAFNLIFMQLGTCQMYEKLQTSFTREKLRLRPLMLLGVALLAR